MTESTQPWRRIEPDIDRSTGLELFFDLAFVLVLFQLSHSLANHLSWHGVFQIAVLTAASWWVWTVVTWTTDIYSSANPTLQLLVIALTFGVIAMAVTVPMAFSTFGPAFTGAYVGIHLVRNSTLLFTGRGKSIQRHVAIRLVLWTLATAPLWFIGAAMQGTTRLMLWAVAVVVDFTVAMTGWPIPLMGRLPLDLWEANAQHLAERYRQIILISIGDAFLTMGLAWIDSRTTPLRNGILALAFLYSVLLWQTYFRVAGEQLAEMISRRRNKAYPVQLTAHCHLLMVLGIVVSSVGIDIVIRHPRGHTNEFWVVVIIVGPTLFMLGRILFGLLVLGRLSPSRMITLIALLAITAVAGAVPPFLNAVLVTAALAFVQAPRFSNRLARRIHEPILEER